MNNERPLNAFCLRCQRHWLKDARAEAWRHLRQLNHPVVFWNEDTRETAREMGVPVDRLLTVPA